MSRRYALLLATTVLWGCQDLQAPAQQAGDDVLMNLAQGGEYRGRYVIKFAEDLERGVFDTTDMLELDDGSMVELRFRGRRPEIPAGARVRVRGERRNGSLDVEDGSTQYFDSFGTNTASVSLTPVTKRVAVVLFNFSNDPSQPYPPSHAAGIAFHNANSVAEYYRSSSWGSVNLVGNVYGWLTIPETNTSGCAYSLWSTSANKVAAAAGIDLSAASYDHVVYAFPASPGCSWSGMGNMPGRLSWLHGSGMSLRTMAHELGHNFGTHHASTYRCWDGGVPVALAAHAADCTRSEYGDPFTIMGASTRRHTNPSLANFAWLPGANRLDVTHGGDYRLAPLFSGDGFQSLRIRRTASSFLTLELREPAGPFDAFPANDPVVNGVTIRLTGDDMNRTQSLLIDTTPETGTFADAPLVPGRTFIDPLSGVSVTTLAVSAAGADVRVSFQGDGQPPSQPGSLKATPLDASRIALSWTASSDNVGVAGYHIQRGGVRVATVSATSFTDTGLAPATSYTYQVTAFDAAGNTSTPASASATTPVLDVVPPTAPTNLTAARGNGQRINLAWDAATDDVGVVGYRVFRNGSEVATVTGTTYTDTMPGGRTPVSYYVVAFDAAGNVSLPSNTVTGR